MVNLSLALTSCFQKLPMSHTFPADLTQRWLLCPRRFDLSVQFLSSRAGWLDGRMRSRAVKLLRSGLHLPSARVDLTGRSSRSPLHSNVDGNQQSFQKHLMFTVTALMINSENVWKVFVIRCLSLVLGLFIDSSLFHALLRSSPLSGLKSRFIYPHDRNGSVSPSC